MLEFTDAFTGKRFTLPITRLVRVNEVENEERCEVVYEELNHICTVTVQESYEMVKATKLVDG